MVVIGREQDSSSHPVDVVLQKEGHPHPNHLHDFLVFVVLGVDQTSQLIIVDFHH